MVFWRNDCELYIIYNIGIIYVEMDKISNCIYENNNCYYMVFFELFMILNKKKIYMMLCGYLL